MRYFSQSIIYNWGARKVPSRNDVLFIFLEPIGEYITPIGKLIFHHCSKEAWY